MGGGGLETWGIPENCIHLANGQYAVIKGQTAEPGRHHFKSRQRNYIVIMFPAPLLSTLQLIFSLSLNPKQSGLCYLIINSPGVSHCHQHRILIEFILLNFATLHLHPILPQLHPVLPNNKVQTLLVSLHPSLRVLCNVRA